MKDAGIHLGSALTGFATYNSIGDLHVFRWWELLLIGFYLLVVCIAGGILGMAVQEKIEQNYE